VTRWQRSTDVAFYHAPRDDVSRMQEKLELMLF